MATLTDKQVHDLNNMNEAARRSMLGDILRNGGGSGSGVTLDQVREITDPINTKVDSVDVTVSNITNNLDTSGATIGQYLTVTDNTNQNGYGWTNGVNLNEFIALQNNFSQLQSAFMSRTPVSGTWEPTWQIPGITYKDTGNSYWVRTGRRVELFFSISADTVDTDVPTVARLGPLPFTPATDALWYPAVVTYSEGFGSAIQNKNWAIHLRNDEPSYRVYVTDNITATTITNAANSIIGGSYITGFGIYYTNETEPTS